MQKELAQFAGRKYINLESFRKNGAGVRTPVWFAESQGTIYVYTLADSFKVKRIRANPRVRIVPSDARGNPRGEWVEGRARILEGEEAARGNRLLSEKYFLKRFFDLLRRFSSRRRAVIAIRLDTAAAGESQP